MLGIGPMLPLVPATDDLEHSSKRPRKRDNTHKTDAEKLALATVRRPSTALSEGTLVGSHQEHILEEPENVARHQRDLSLIADFDLERAAKQLKNGDIADIDLALFSFWIRAKSDNYIMAKKLVRELALDQGYNVDKINNPRIRKLLQETHDIRPREPGYILQAEDSLQDSIPDSMISESTGIRKVASHLTARIDTLPPSLRIKRELAVQEAVRPTRTTDDAINYPPNTPDRPAPLSVKTRSSQVSNSTEAYNGNLRSVSTPVKSAGSPALRPPESLATVTRNEDILLNNFSTPGSSRGDNGDVFDDLQGERRGYRSYFTSKLNDSRDRRHGSLYERAREKSDRGFLADRYPLDAFDFASDCSSEDISGIAYISERRASAETSCNPSVTGDVSFDALESYAGSDDEDKYSILESASTTSDQEGRIQYQFATPVSEPQNIIAGPTVPTRTPLTAAKSRTETQSARNNGPAVNFHRPLPLRSYESEATMFPTAGAQGDSSRNRAKSAGSIIDSTRAAVEVMHYRSPAAPSQTYTADDHADGMSTVWGNSPTKVSERVHYSTISASEHSSNVTTPESFPLPPMRSSVDDLTVLVSRATLSRSTPYHSISQRPMATPSLEDTYRAITKVNMIALLQRTRSRGEQMQLIAWEELTSFERAWRDMHEVLLVTIYGRKDVILNENDVEYIDCVAAELGKGSIDIASGDWVRCMFENGT